MMNKKTVFIIIIILAAVFLLAMSGNEEKIFENEPTEEQEEQKEHPDLLIEDIRKGEGSAVKAGDELTVHYQGMLEDGTVFDSSIEKEKTFTFRLGEGRVIEGWEIGMEGMREGGKRRLTIPPELAYGQGGVRDMVPPNATIVFEIELIRIKN